MVADRSRLEQGSVVACVTGINGYVHVSTGAFLPRDHQVRIVKRYLRGKLYDNPGATFLRLCECSLDTSRNDSVNHATTYERRVGKLYRETLAELRVELSQATYKNDVKKVLSTATSRPYNEKMPTKNILCKETEMSLKGVRECRKATCKSDVKNVSSTATSRPCNEKTQTINMLCNKTEVSVEGARGCRKRYYETAL